MATNPIFIKEGNLTPVRITALNATSDGSGTVGTDIFVVATGGADGTRVDGIRFRNAQNTALGSPTGVSSNNLFKIFISDLSGVVSNALNNPRLIGEKLMTGTTRTNNSATIGATDVFYFEQPIILQANQVLAVSQHVYNAIYAGVDQTDVFAFAGDY